MKHKSLATFGIPLVFHGKNFVLSLVLSPRGIRYWIIDKNTHPRLLASCGGSPPQANLCVQPSAEGAQCQLIQPELSVLALSFDAFGRLDEPRGPGLGWISHFHSRPEYQELSPWFSLICTGIMAWVKHFIQLSYFCLLFLLRSKSRIRWHEF